MRLTLPGSSSRASTRSKDLAFGQLTEQFIHDYQSFATEEKGYAIDTVRHHLAILKKICRLAYKEGYADRIHFQHFTLPKKTETTPRALSRESFEKIRDVEIPAYRKSHILARDMFLFGCYTGVCYADVVSITHENLYTDEDGALWLKYRRKKNELRASVKLLPEAIALIEKYHSEDRDTLFPLLHWSNLRRHMKALAALAGIKDDLCYHQARHSFASLITLEAGVPIETISRMLGHSDISTTQVYARVSPKKLFEDMDQVHRSQGDRLREYLRLTEESYNEILKSQGVVSAEMLKNHISLNNIHPTTLLQMGEWERERLKKHSEEDRFHFFLSGFNVLSKVPDGFSYVHREKGYSLEEVTEDFGKSYKAHLKKCKNFGVSDQPLPALAEPPVVSCRRQGDSSCKSL